jgi:hypothetical protein
MDFGIIYGIFWPYETCHFARMDSGELRNAGARDDRAHSLNTATTTLIISYRTGADHDQPPDRTRPL